MIIEMAWTTPKANKSYVLWRGSMLRALIGALTLGWTGQCHNSVVSTGSLKIYVDQADVISGEARTSTAIAITEERVTHDGNPYFLPSLSQSLLYVPESRGLWARVRDYIYARPPSAWSLLGSVSDRATLTRLMHFTLAK